MKHRVSPGPEVTLTALPRRSCCCLFVSVLLRPVRPLAQIRPWVYPASVLFNSSNVDAQKQTKKHNLPDSEDQKRSVCEKLSVGLGFLHMYYSTNYQSLLEVLRGSLWVRCGGD